MDHRPIIPQEFQSGAEALKMSPGIISGDHIFLSGVTGSGSDGHMPEDPGDQIRQAFTKITLVLEQAGLTFGAVVEMTSYHIGLREHFDTFCAIRDEYVRAPFPAWTAIEVAGLRRQGAVVEIRAIARINDSDPGPR